MEEVSLNSLLSSHGEVVSDLTTLFEFHNEVCKALEDEYNDNVGKLKDFLFGGSKNREKALGEKTPQQIKKRSKRLSAVDEEENNVSGSSLSQHDVSESSISSKKSTRPPRAAKMNLNLKEKPLGQKIRRPSNFDPHDLTNFYIKQEKTDDTIIKSDRIKNDVQSSKASIKVQVEAMEVDHNEKNLNCDASILIVQKQDVIVELESDGEADRMPPPQVPAPKKRTAKKKLSQELLKVELPKPIKSEKTSMESTDSTLKRDETDSDMSQQPSTTPKQKKKGKKTKAVPKPILIKLEKLSLTKNNIEGKSSIETNKNALRNSQKSIRGGSFESVYEDAVAHQIENLKLSGKTTNIEYMNTDEIQSTNNTLNHKDPSVNTANIRTSVAVADSTFVSAKDIPTTAHNIAIPMTDATFVQSTTPTQTTFVLDDKNLNLDATTTIKQGKDIKIFNSDATFDVAMNPEANPSETYVRESIMTEDNSQDENDMVEEEQQEIVKKKYKPVSKMNKNQIFNPFIQSPLKKKIEAFEKVAADAVEQNPPPRQTRTKTRAKQQQQNENVDIQNKQISTLKESSKNLTPSIGRPLGRILTPSQSSSSITPTIGAAIKKMPNSASKAIGITKALTTGSKISASSQSAQQARDNSIERGYRKFQELAAERRKKREEKQQQATLVREQKEKERADRLKRIMEEREEKLKAAEQKRNVEEIQKNLKLIEEKNELKKKLEKQKLLEKQAATAAAKKEREILENRKIQKAKEEMQLKLLKNQKEMKFKELPLYNFDMLQTDDETDDEDEIAKKRPPLPNWSKKEDRKVALDIQSYLPTAIVDNFFSVQPLNLDLKDIFPTIDPRYCRRNSSAYWSTPPRYSQLPKY